MDSNLYIWEQLAPTAKTDKLTFTLSGPAKVTNRRKYPRLEINNTCEIEVDGKALSATLSNISAGGVALKVSGSSMISYIDHPIKIVTHDLPLKNNVLHGRIIRCSSGENINYLGCRLLSDRKDIEEFVNTKIR